MRATPSLAALIVGAGLALPGLAAAQSTPSPNAIVRALTPTTGSGETRGIRVVHGAGGAAASGPASAPVAPRPASVSLTVDFASGSAELTPAAMRTLDALGKALNDPKLVHDRFRIEGHTDTVGTATGNQALSEARAKRVAQYLEDKYGVTPARLSAIGMGEQGLAVQTPPQTPDARNRRVVVINEGA
ncbi:MAG: OmpA family protein [Rhodospirillales bacterium]|nr:OmpA family protein [Rhodospirillales bacterium]